MILITLVHFVLVQSKCSNEAYGLYCTELSHEDDNEDVLIFKSNDSFANDNVKAIFLRNSSGKIVKDSFELYPKVKSLDIQYCEVESFLTGDVDLQNLYLMNNRKFPVLTKDFLKNCCGNLMTLYIVDNKDLEIEEGILFCDNSPLILKYTGRLVEKSFITKPMLN